MISLLASTETVRGVQVIQPKTKHSKWKIMLEKRSGMISLLSKVKEKLHAFYDKN